jgi:hypothetical protein
MRNQISTHRVIQLSELAYSASCDAAVNARAAANAAAIGNRSATRAFIARSSRLNAIAVRINQRLAVQA